jgi:hypothetical protein
MATFYVEGKVDLTILFMMLGMQKSQIFLLLYMFGFQHGYIHVFRDDVYNDNSVVKNSIY